MKSPHVVFILDSNGFPHGMAATQRVKLLAKALLLKGFRVTVLCVRALERPPVENLAPRGCYQGIDFEYTPGRTARANSFVRRRWLEIRGFLISVLRLLQFRKSSDVCYIYLWGAMENLTFLGGVYRGLSKVLKVPLLTELNERPWSLKEKPSFFEKRLSPLSGSRGVVVISSFLKHWVRAEVQRTSKKVAVQYTPILVDNQEAIDPHPPVSRLQPVLIFAGSPRYSETIRFLFEVMKLVIKKYPLCQLKVTGVKNTDPAGIWLRSDPTCRDMQKNIQLVGYVSRSELLTLYRQSNAVLIPLFNDIRSQARFPTKLGEYLCSGRPVITNKVGELTNYLINDHSAFLCECGNPVDYATAICRVLDDPARAEEIGLRGRAVAQQHFEYTRWAEPLSKFIRELEKDQVPISPEFHESKS